MCFHFCKFIWYFVDLCGNEISRCNISQPVSKLSQSLKVTKAGVALLASNSKDNTQHYPTWSASKTHITQSSNADCSLHCLSSDSILPPSFPPSLPLPHPCTQQSLPVWSAWLAAWQAMHQAWEAERVSKAFYFPVFALSNFDYIHSSSERLAGLTRPLFLKL